MTEEKKLYNKYGDGKIYLLRNSIDEKIYVGSTTRSLRQRRAEHEHKAKLSLTRIVYAHLNPIGWSNVTIELIEDFPCNNRDELQDREKHWIQQRKAALNTVSTARTTKYPAQARYYKTHREEVRAGMKKHYAKKPVIQCGCGGKGKVMTMHRKGKKHIAWEAAEKLKQSAAVSSERSA
jgi:group I intron endonuclease